MPKRLSFQLYSARNFKPWDKLLAHLAACGYAEVEGYGDPDIYETPEAFRALMDANGLSMPTGHVFPLAMFERERKKVVKIARTLGMRALYCPYILPEEQPKSGTGWKAWGKRLATVAHAMREEGFAFGWHNHDFEFVKLRDGSFPIERIFDGGPLLDWECDIAWVAFARQNPVKWFKTYGERITAVHLKDNAKAGENADQQGQTDVGAGVLKWPEIFAALKNTRTLHYVVEHDNPKDVWSFARNSFKFASKM
ncbi:sugar phosphate isomerase/epimerase family protein [Aestuariivirga sp.]|uniref:sugar phosphate isomerase/epimerase family protein n=1 Tax=Aestuariivirga sp. TaxID=2650926 RepID=UPI0039E23CC4